jgi:glycosyltransferase involved in cell wall biosynthesis
MADRSTPRIGLDYTAAIHQTAGIGRTVRELVDALTEPHPPAPSPYAERGSLRLFVAGARRAELPPLPPVCTYCPSPISERNHARLWHRLRLPVPVELWTGPLDLYHAADFALPPTLPRTRTVLTIYDLAFEHYPADTMPGMLDHLRRVVPRSAQRADCVIAISEATRRDVIALYGLPPEKVIAIPLGVSPRFHLTPHPPPPQGEGEVRARYGLPGGPLVLTVGTMQPRKNHLRLVQAFARLKTEAVLVIAGGQGWAYEAVRDEVVRLRIADRVFFTGFVDDNDLPRLYNAAAVFVYPALYEGFGLPVLEAMACGVPVITSNVSSLPEVAGDAALLVDPLDVDAIAVALDRLLVDERLRASLREKGIARAGQFTWARAAEKTWGVYRALLG